MIETVYSVTISQGNNSASYSIGQQSAPAINNFALSTYINNPGYVLFNGSLMYGLQNGAVGNAQALHVDSSGNLLVSSSASSAPNLTFTHTNPTVTNSSGSILAANTARRYLLVQNKDTAGSVYIRFGSAATTALGILLAPGASYEPLQISGQQVFAIGSIASNTNVIVVEGQ